MNLLLAYLHQIRDIDIQDENIRVLFTPLMISLTIFLPITLQKSEITKGNMNKFLTKPLMIRFTKKLSFKNADT